MIGRFLGFAATAVDTVFNTLWPVGVPPRLDEPPLSNDELVALRGMIQERYEVPPGATRLSAEDAEKLLTSAFSRERGAGSAGEDAALAVAVAPPAERPTSELLYEAAAFLGIFNTDLGFIDQLRDRAAQFAAIAD